MKTDTRENGLIASAGARITELPTQIQARFRPDPVLTVCDDLPKPEGKVGENYCLSITYGQ